MPIKKVSICDVCGKQQDTERAIKEYFIHNISHVYCSKECYDNHHTSLEEVTQNNQ